MYATFALKGNRVVFYFDAAFFNNDELVFRNWFSSETLGL